MDFRSRTVIGIIAVAATCAIAATPLQAETNTYGGIGATAADFKAAHENGVGSPPPGTTYYRIVDVGRYGRVSHYQVVVGWNSKPSASKLLARLTGRQLPTDAKVVKPYNGYCAIYRSRWLGRTIGLPYIVVYAPEHSRNGGVMASGVPKCRG